MTFTITQKPASNGWIELSVEFSIVQGVKQGGILRERPFNLRGGGGGLCFFLFFFKYSDSQCCWKKYSDFGGGKKK